MEYTLEKLKQEGAEIFNLARSSRKRELLRDRLIRLITRYQFELFYESNEVLVDNIVRVRDCSRALRAILTEASDNLAGFSVVSALHDIGRGRARPDLQPGFYAELIHLIMGMQGRGPGLAFHARA